MFSNYRLIFYTKQPNNINNIQLIYVGLDFFFQLYLLYQLLKYILIGILLVASQVLLVVRNKMSHMLQVPNKLVQPKCILSIPCRQVVMPKYRKLLHQSQSLSHFAKKQVCKQERMMRNLCQKLTEKQLQRLQIMNQISMKKQFQKIKKNMKNNALSKSRQSQVIKYFQGKEDHESLSSILRQHTQNIQIGIKYQTKLTNKLTSIKEASQIDKDKQNYRSWLDTCNNSPLKSPNYSKMNFIMEKISKKKELNNIFNLQTAGRSKNHSNSQSVESFKYYKPMRTSDQTGVNPILNQKQNYCQYSPKSKISGLTKKIRLKN